MTNMPDISQITKVADYASLQSDRWLFLFTLAILGLVVIFIAKYFMHQYSALLADHRIDRDKYQASLMQIITQQSETTRSLAVTLDRNTDALKDCTTELRLLRESTK